MQFIKAITNEMISKGIINENESNVYVYGLELVVLKFVAAIMALVFSFVIGTTGFLLALLVFLIPMRKYAGGVHAPTRLLCLLFTEIILIVAQVIWKYELWHVEHQLVSVVVGFFSIIAFSPKENAKRPLSELERKYFRKKAIIYGGICGSSYFLSMYLPWPLMQSASSLAMFLEASLLMLSTYVNKRNGCRENITK